MESAVAAPAEVRSILRQSCFHCHSKETEWPWYGYLAPFSWLVSHHVHEARAEINFSTWERLSEQQQAEIIHEIWEEVDKGAMPPQYYLITHPRARLSDVHRVHLHSWGEARGGDSGHAGADKDDDD